MTDTDRLAALLAAAEESHRRGYATVVVALDDLDALLAGVTLLDEEWLARALDRHMADFEAEPESFETSALVAANVYRHLREDSDD